MSLDEPQGQAARLLIESLIFELVDLGVLPVERACYLVRSAMNVKVEVVNSELEKRAIGAQSIGLLRRLETSLLAIEGEATSSPDPVKEDYHDEPTRQ